MILKEFISYIISFFALFISILTFYFTIFRGAKLRIAQVERLDFYSRFNSDGKYIGDLEVPIVIINEGTKIGVLSDLHLFVLEPAEYHGRRIRTPVELEELPCAVKNQESMVFRIRVKKTLPLKPEIEYKTKIIGRTRGKEINSSFKFILTREDWNKLQEVKKYIKML
ncbi:MAG: hypothetical protein PVF58_04760 [Candidatus Methanofastidiosia archaeon]